MQNIAVVGCGAVGLTTALAIQTRLQNVNVTIFAKEFSPNTTSDISAGYWQPFLLGDTPANKIFKWSKITYDYLLKLWKEGKACEAGISLIPATVLTNAEDFVSPELLNITLGYSDLSKQQLAEYSMKLNQTFTKGFTFLSFTWEASIFLPYFQSKFVEAGGRITKRNISDLHELKDYDLIVNCTGLDSKTVVGDPLMKPIRGQVCRIAAPSIFHITAVDRDPPSYIIPNINSVVLGGTSQIDDNLYVDDNDKNNILNNCSKLVPAIKSAEIIKHQVGLRPGRDRVRLEAEIKSNGKNVLKVVHNYGHGGAGITLSVGCAIEAAELAGQILEARIRNKL